MAVIHSCNDCSLIDHNKYISRLYRRLKENKSEKVEVIESASKNLRLNSSLFSIINIKKSKVKKINNRIDHINHDTAVVKQMFINFLQDLPNDCKTMVSNLRVTSTHSVRDLSKQLFETTAFDHIGISGGNNIEQPLVCNIKGETFLIPGDSKFLCGSVEEQCKKLIGNKYNLVVADPPWWNKYIRRLKTANEKLSYSMMYNEDIALIPVKELLSTNCIIAVWCTNAPSNIAAVKELIFPKWGVEYVTTWYWLKVTTDLEPLCDFGTGCQKQPYERILLGKVGDVKNIPCNQLIISVPSALHSHKPPLLELLSPYLNSEQPQTLELFARYLLPDTTSVGYEPLKWQHLSLYESVTYLGV